MSLQVPRAHLLDLASAYWELYRAKLRADVQATPLIFPLHLAAYWIIPSLYLAIPHKNRLWLYRARWLVLAFVCTFHYYMIKYVKSPNFAASYGVRIIASWGTIWNFYLLVWTKPQWDARRVERLRVSQPINRPNNDRMGDQLPVSPEKGAPAVNKPNKPNSQAVAISEIDRIALNPRSGQSNGNALMRKRKSNAVQENGVQAGEEEVLVERIIFLNSGKNPPLNQNAALELYRRAQEQEYEYYWEKFPANASFQARLDWVFDIVSTFRLTGWDSAPSCLPPYEPPPTIGPYQLPLEYGSQLVSRIRSFQLFLRTGPGGIVVTCFRNIRSKQGYERTVLRRKLVLSRLFVNFLPSYIIIDVCAALMTNDPYFIAGPEHRHPLPSPSAPLSSAHNPRLRGSSFCAAIVRMKADSAGYQTFRVRFSAPTKWLLRLSYFPSPRRHGSASTLIGPVVGTIIAFVQSGIIQYATPKTLMEVMIAFQSEHACLRMNASAAGSYASMPMRYHWGPPIFFALSSFGIVLQTMLSRGLRRRIKRSPLWSNYCGCSKQHSIYVRLAPGYWLNSLGRFRGLRYLALGARPCLLFQGRWNVCGDMIETRYLDGIGVLGIDGEKQVLRFNDFESGRE
ncbi:hypothetical protein RRF57_003803 [Xylaria bambusicola]|uniref:Wax synthase domain-containing protein n=1 Tax=Xylaria bambusicola TaxID=326684 RepID=A0AAN7Z5Q2_9PEZI